MDLFQTMTAEADDRLLEDAREQCLERALACRAHEMYRLLKAFSDAYMRVETVGPVWEEVAALLCEIDEDCK
jgi:hypothetical protein